MNTTYSDRLCCHVLRKNAITKGQINLYIHFIYDKIFINIIAKDEETVECCTKEDTAWLKEIIGKDSAQPYYLC